MEHMNSHSLDPSKLYTEVVLMKLHILAFTANYLLHSEEAANK